jgi:hypothetical protein
LEDQGKATCQESLKAIQMLDRARQATAADIQLQILESTHDRLVDIAQSSVADPNPNPDPNPRGSELF